MSNRIHRMYAKAHAIAYFYAAAVLVAPAFAQDINRDRFAGHGRLAWFGCWDALADSEDAAEDRPEERQMICVAPGRDPEALDMTVLIDGRIVSEERIVADGSRQLVSDGGCDGWIQSRLSEDRRRIYLRSEAACADAQPRILTGASLITSESRWIDIHALRVGGDRELQIQRYRPVEADLFRLPGALPNSVRAARLAAATPLTVDDVLEALRVVDPEVVEAMLVESRARFGINSDLLLRLDDAGVPGEVIDVMVALSFPEHFVVERGAITQLPEVYYGGHWSPWYPYYGYGHYYHHRYAHDDGNRGGKVVSGVGFVQVRPSDAAIGGFGGLFRGGHPTAGGAGVPDVSSGSAFGGGSASGSGFKSGSSTPTRPAVPKRPQ